ncbi:MAG: 6-hydroxymethylpterin diphosphokinase MptE-like protein [Candidatus Anammoxibacter sp.]
MNIYDKNLEALKKRHPDLVELVEATTIDGDKIKVLPTESGDHRVLYKKDDGEEVFVHSAEDPAKCANQAIDLLGKMDKEGIAVLFGFGLGYFAEEVLERFEKGHILIVYEATTEIFKTALQTRDLTDLLESEKINIILGKDADNFAIIHRNYHLIANGKFWIVKHHPSVKLNEKAYDKFKKRLEEERSLVASNVSTLMGLGKDFINVFLSNVPLFFRNPGIKQLEGIFKGRPAVVVAAGPSLDKNIHLLKKCKDRAIIIAVDAALPTLLPCNVIPDIIVAIDPLPENMVMFKDKPILKEVPFVCLAQYTPEIVRLYPGPLFLNGVPSNIIYQWLAGFWDDKGVIESGGGSVSHLAFSVSRFLGCDVIAFVGMDLSLSDKSLHSKGFGDITLDESTPEQGWEYSVKTDFKDIPDEYKWHIPILKEAIKKGKEPWDYLVRKTRGIPGVDIFGENVLTMSNYLTFRITFQNMIRLFDGIVINATEAGLPIEGAKNMRLQDFIDEYCSLPEIDTFSVITEKADAEVGYNLEGLIANVEKAKTIFTGIKKNGEKILKYTHRVKDLVDKEQRDSAKLHDLLGKIEVLTEKVKHPVLNIIASYHYKLELYLKKQEVQEIDEIDDEWERLEKQLARAENYYPELIEAITLFLEPLNRLISDLEREGKVDSILKDSSRSEYYKYSKVGKIYKNAGMVTPAVRYLELAIDAVGRGQRTENREQLAVGSWQEAEDSGQWARGSWQEANNKRQKAKNNETGKRVNGETENSEDDVSQLVTLQVALAEMYLKQFRFYDTKELLETVISDQLTVDGRLKTKDQRPKTKDKIQKVEKLLKTCDKKIEEWENRKLDMGKLLEDAEANYGGYYESGEFYFKVKDFERAEKAYLKAIEEQVAGDGEKLAVGSWQLAETGQQKTKSSIQQPAISNPQSSILNVYYGLANTYLAMDKSEEAVDTIGKIIELEPGNPYPYCDLGRISAQNNNVEAAENFFKKAIELAPHIEDHYKLLAGLYVNLGQTEKATALYDQAILTNPGNPAFVQTLAELYKNIISNISTQT